MSELDLTFWRISVKCPGHPHLARFEEQPWRSASVSRESHAAYSWNWLISFRTMYIGN